jgi:hypothetical protein
LDELSFVVVFAPKLRSHNARSVKWLGPSLLRRRTPFHALFAERINDLHRPSGPDGKRRRTTKSSSLPWDIGIQVRSRGTVQSDRWRGKIASLTGDKLVAIVPVLGWWDQRHDPRRQGLRFSLIVSVSGPGVYGAIQPHVEIPVETTVSHKAAYTPPRRARQLGSSWHRVFIHAFTGSAPCSRSSRTCRSRRTLFAPVASMTRGGPEPRTARAIIARVVAQLCGGHRDHEARLSLIDRAHNGMSLMCMA